MAALGETGGIFGREEAADPVADVSIFGLLQGDSHWPAARCPPPRSLLEALGLHRQLSAPLRLPEDVADAVRGLIDVYSPAQGEKLRWCVEHYIPMINRILRARDALNSVLAGMLDGEHSVDNLSVWRHCSLI